MGRLIRMAAYNSTEKKIVNKMRQYMRLPRRQFLWRSRNNMINITQTLLTNKNCRHKLGHAQII